MGAGVAGGGAASVVVSITGGTVGVSPVGSEQDSVMMTDHATHLQLSTHRSCTRRGSRSRDRRFSL